MQFTINGQTVESIDITSDEDGITMRLSRLGLGLGVLPIGGGGVTPPPIAPAHWWDMTEAANMTMDGSGLVSGVTAQTGGQDLTSAGTTDPQWLAADAAAPARLRMAGDSRFTIPAAVIINKRDCTVVIIARAVLPYQTAFATGATGTSALISSFATGASNTTLMNLYGDAVAASATTHVMKYRDQFSPSVIDKDPGTVFPMNSAAYIIRGGAASALIGLSNKPLAATTLNSVLTEGGWIGAWSGGAIYYAWADYQAVLIFDSALSDTDLNSVLDWASTRYGSTAHTADTMLIFDGDSITRGSISASPQAGHQDHSFPAVVSQGRTDFDILNVGRPSQTLNGYKNDPITKTWASTSVAKGYGSVVMFCLWGHNDLQVGFTDVEMKANLDAWITNMRAAAAGVVLGAGTILPSTAFSATMLTRRTAYNAYVMDTSVSGPDLDFQIDTAAAFPGGADATYFYDTPGTGYVHPNVAGYAVLGGHVKTGLIAAGVIAA
jgi:lysophospholipase L1-like esterase